MWVVYGLPDKCPEVHAMTEGLATLGWPFRVLNHNGYGERQIEPKAVGAVINGTRGKGALILRDHVRAGLPVIVMDYGYMDRVHGVDTFETGHWQVGINRLGWMPKHSCPGDRMAKLTPVQRLKRRGSSIYVCGQYPGDPSHGLGYSGIRDWAKCAIDTLKQSTDRKIVWRPHPGAPVNIENVENDIGPMDWKSVHAIVTINSNVGLDALRRGVPVVAQRNSPYGSLAHSDFAEGLPRPDPFEVEAYCRRASYAQWTLEEIRCGQPLNWMNSRKLLQAAAI